MRLCDVICYSSIATDISGFTGTREDSEFLFNASFPGAKPRQHRSNEGEKLTFAIEATSRTRPGTNPPAEYGLWVGLGYIFYFADGFRAG